MINYSLLEASESMCRAAEESARAMAQIASVFGVPQLYWACTTGSTAGHMLKHRPVSIMRKKIRRMLRCQGYERS